MNELNGIVFVPMTTVEFERYKTHQEPQLGTPQQVRVNFQSNGDLEQDVTDALNLLGVPRHIKGFTYMREAIMLCVNDRNYIEAITKILYPELAKFFNTTPSRVERAIRHAIEVVWGGWGKRQLEAIDSLFGYTVNPSRGKPTNSEFIAMMADNLRLRRKNKTEPTTDSAN